MKDTKDSRDFKMTVSHKIQYLSPWFKVTTSQALHLHSTRIGISVEAMKKLKEIRKKKHKKSRWDFNNTIFFWDLKLSDQL